jgi:putative SOS response-associated peptidase YedK
MCGRGVLNADIKDAIRELGLVRHPDELAPRYNISPGYNGAGAPWIVRVGDDGEREMITARWWLIPSWWKQPLKKLPTTFNARSETIATSRLFKGPFAKRRCLMPATGWYEFQGKLGAKRSFCFHLPEWRLFAFAAIYENWINPDDGEVVTSFAIVTCEPTPQAATIHDRMPVLLHARDYAQWLDPSNHDTASMQQLLKPWDGELLIYETRGLGNNPRHEGADCLEPAVV